MPSIHLLSLSWERWSIQLPTKFVGMPVIYADTKLGRPSKFRQNLIWPKLKFYFDFFFLNFLQESKSKIFKTRWSFLHSFEFFSDISSFIMSSEYQMFLTLMCNFKCNKVCSVHFYIWSTQISLIIYSNKILKSLSHVRRIS